MVCASSAARKPEGGFCFISVRQLCWVWWAYSARLIRFIDLRVWFAAHELVARRCQLRPGQQPVYTCAELSQLVGGGGGIPAALQRLTAVGLLGWAVDKISFADEPPPARECPGLWTMLAQTRNHDRLVPVPRRLLRYIAGGCRRGVVATILGHLFRCLYYRQGKCQAEGFCKASWIAEVFGVSLRTVKTARHELERLELLQRRAVPQWVLNRYGQKMTINLQWAPATAQGAESHPAPHRRTPVAAVPFASAPHGLTPPPELSTRSFAPPDSYRKLFPRTEHQKPADGGPPGVLRALFAQAREAVREGTAPLDDPESVVLRTVSAPHRQGQLPAPDNAPVSLSSPTLRNIVLQDLHDPGRLLALYGQAVQAGLIGAAEADRLTFVALACHVLRSHPQNAGGLLYGLLRRKLYQVVTQEDEDAAQQRLRQYLYDEGTTPPRRATA